MTRILHQVDVDLARLVVRLSAELGVAVEPVVQDIAASTPADIASYNARLAAEQAS